MSFRGIIAVPLETDIKAILKEALPFSADVIECGGFVSCLFFLLIVKQGITEEVNDFQKKYNHYAGLSYNEIPFDTAIKIYQEYKKLLKIKEF